MRILYICNEYPPEIHGGIGIFVQTMAERLAEMGHATAVIGYSSIAERRTRSVERGVEVVRLPFPKSNLKGRQAGRLRAGASMLSVRATLSREARRLAREFEPAVTESYDWSGPLWKAPARPLVVRLHGAATLLPRLETVSAGRLMRFLEGRNLRLADAVVSASEDIGRRTWEAFDLAFKSRQTIHHGIDTDLFKPRDVSRDSHEVLFAATIKRQKGILDLFGAIPAIVAECCDARFAIAGRALQAGCSSCSPDWLLRQLPAEIRTKVRFLGAVPHDELPLHYSRAAVVVFPSHAEAFGLGCAEAMACGAAVVMTARGSGPELVEDGRCGLLVEPSNRQELARSVVRLLQNEELRQRLGQQARFRVVERFGLSAATTHNLAFYEGVVNGFHRFQISRA